MPRRNGDGAHDESVGVLPAIAAPLFEFLLMLATAWLIGKSAKKEERD